MQRSLNVTSFFPVIALALGLALGACSLSGAQGEGDVVRQARTVSGFTQIRLQLSGKVEVRPGAFAVEVEAQPNLQPLIETRVEGSTLVITSSQPVRSNKELHYFVTMPNLEEATIEGSGDVILKDGFAPAALRLNVNGSGNIRGKVKAGQLAARIAGSGDIDVQGSAEDFTGNIEGSGDIDGAGLAARTAKLHIAGSGDISAQVSESLDVNIAGSGSVSYKGNPTMLHQQVDGSGSIRKM